jgi:hypothetical protein
MAAVSGTLYLTSSGLAGYTHHGPFGINTSWFPKLAATADASCPYGVVAGKALLVESGARRPELLPHLQLDELLAELQGQLHTVLSTRDRMRGLLEAVVAIGSGLDLESTLARLVETAVGLVDATYGGSA